MKILSNGKYMYEDLGDLYYNLFIELGLAVDPVNGYLYDTDSRITIRFKDKYIKASVLNIPVYAGKNDIVFEPWKNYSLMTSLFGYYIDKCTVNGDLPFNIIAQYIEDDNTKEKQRVVIRINNQNSVMDIASDFYNNIYLCYIQLVFKLSEIDVDLTNFDIVFE